jgi:hypothetical protein
VQEASWVRSVYLYLMCLVSIVLVGFGAIAFVLGFVHTIAPDLGHRDTIDRVGIGLANIASEVVDVLNEAEGGDSEAFCRDVTDSDSDFEDCMDDQGVSEDATDSIQNGIAEVKSELEGQIRNNSIDHMIRGLLLIGAGALLFHIHGRRTELFADGLIPKPPTPVQPPGPLPAPEPVTLAPLPPPPGAPPAP